MRITGLEQQAHNRERLNLFLDNAFALGISADVVVSQRLHVGKELSEADLELLKQMEERQQAIERAIVYLSFRPRSEAEVRAYLRKKETPPVLIDDVLEYLKTRDYVNDKSFADFWVENRSQFKPRGARALRAELRQKGINRDVADEAIDEDDEHEDELALTAGRKKATQLVHSATMDFQTFRSRLSGFLQRRGFAYDVTSRTVKALWNELKAEDTDDTENIPEDRDE